MPPLHPQTTALCLLQGPTQPPLLSVTPSSTCGVVAGALGALVHGLLLPGVHGLQRGCGLERDGVLEAKAGFSLRKNQGSPGRELPSSNPQELARKWLSLRRRGQRDRWVGQTGRQAPWLQPECLVLYRRLRNTLAQGSDTPSPFWVQPGAQAWKGARKEA